MSNQVELLKKCCPKSDPQPRTTPMGIYYLCPHCKLGSSAQTKDSDSRLEWNNLILHFGTLTAPNTSKTESSVVPTAVTALPQTNQSINQNPAEEASTKTVNP